MRRILKLLFFLNIDIISNFESYLKSRYNYCFLNYILNLLNIFNFQIFREQKIPKF